LAAYLPYLGLEPADGPLQSMTYGQSDNRPTVNFPAVGHCCSVTGDRSTCV